MGSFCNAMDYVYNCDLGFFYELCITSKLSYERQMMIFPHEKLADVRF